MELEPTYHLEGIIRSKEDLGDFEGPLTLILMLLSKNKIEIRDIRISEILDQYLAYLDEMKAMDLEIASEFVQMASHLLYIKTRMLLSADKEVSELEMLISSLEQLKSRDVYASVKEICPDLQRAAEQGILYYTKEPEPLPNVKEYRYHHECWELLKALSDTAFREAASEEDEAAGTERFRRITPKRIVYNVRDKSREILLRLRSGAHVTLGDFFSESRSRSEVVATFLSILELCSLGYTSMTREGENVVLRFTGGDVEDILEQISE